MTDIFTQDSTESNTNEAANQQAFADLVVNKLMEIKRPDGTPKYESIEAALDALKASQDHIQNIETENATLRQKASEIDAVNEALKNLGGNMNNNGNSNPPTGDQEGRSVEAAEELVARLLDKKLGEREQVNTAISNVKKVQDALVGKYGEAKAVEEINRKAKSLNTTAEALKELSAQNPQLVLELFGSASSTPSGNNSSINLGGYTPPAEKLAAPEKSLLSGSGATYKNQIEYFNKIRANVNKRLGVTD